MTLLYTADDLPGLVSPWQTMIETLAFEMEYDKARQKTPEHRKINAKSALEYYYRNRETIIAGRDKAKRAAYDKKYREKNKVAIAARKKEWAAANKERILAKQKARRLAKKQLA